MRHPHRKLLVWPRRAPKIDLLVRSLNLNFTNARTSRRPKLISPRRAPKINLPRLSPKLNYCFFFKSPTSSALPGMTSFTSPVPFSSLGFLLWHLWLSHPPHACINTCTQLTHALTNPCTKRKVLSLTKPKGNIYKTKNDNIKKIPPQLYYSFMAYQPL